MGFQRSPLLCLLAAGSLAAQQAPEPPSTTVQVTATRFAEDPLKVPGSVTVITGKELEDRGATDLGSALALVAGLGIAPGGDAGPASSVPEFWGLREFDAFLLVVDGVPWGGTFNPSLATLDLRGVERIEIQKGAAPVMYGATSFVGVIHVIHHQPGDTQGMAEIGGGSHGSLDGAVITKLPKWAGFDSSLALDYRKTGFNDPRTEVKRSHLLWRNRMDSGDGSFHFDLDGSWMQTMPGSPMPVADHLLAGQSPLDANHNPAGAHMNEGRVALNLGYDRKAGSALWTTTLGVSRSAQSLFRGFLINDTSDPAIDANGFREHVWMTDIYFDTHMAWTDTPGFKVVAGLDHMHGQGIGRGGDFDYFVNLDGSNPPTSDQLPPAADVRFDNHRDFSGLYGFVEWNPTSSLTVEGGLRLNHTRETRHRFEEDLGSGTVLEDSPVNERSSTKLSGSVGLTWGFWQSGAERLALFANYKNTFKPAAVDFGLDSGAEILNPEAARSYEAGLKGVLMGGRLGFEVDAFLMDFSNLVVSQNGALVNGGKQRFKGVEGELSFRITKDFLARASASYHDARFRDFDDAGTQLAGNRLEASPLHLASFGLLYAPSSGFFGSIEANYVGSFYMDRDNVFSSGGYTTLAAGAGYRLGPWEFRVDGRNLSDKRVPVAASEMGEAQYYILPGRRVDATLRFRF